MPEMPELRRPSNLVEYTMFHSLSQSNAPSRRGGIQRSDAHNYREVTVLSFACLLRVPRACVPLSLASPRQYAGHPNQHVASG